MPDKRGRVTVTLKPSHQKMLKDIQDATGKDENEVFLDSLKTEHRTMIHTGEIQVSVDSDVVVRMARKIAVIMGNTGEDLKLLDDATLKNVDGNSTVNVRMT